MVAALVFQHQKLALDGSDGRLVTLPNLRGLADRRQRIVVGVPSCRIRNDRIQHRAQVLHVEQQQARCSSATRNATLSTPSCTSFRSIMRDSSSGPISETVARTGWPCSPNTSQNTVENWSGWKVEAHIAGPLDDEILGLADFGDARQVALDVGREHRNAGARKSFGHHLQRDGLSGSGRAGDETVAICKRQRQPGRLLALADENLLVGIGQSCCRMSPSHRLFARIEGSVAKRHHYTASCKPIETGQRPSA